MIHVESGEVDDPLSVPTAKTEGHGKEEPSGQEVQFAPESSSQVRSTSIKARDCDEDGVIAHDDDDDSNENGEGANQIDNYASYGQLVGPPSYEESVMYDSVVKAGGETEPAVDTQGPALVISVDDPQRRELPVILKINSGYIQYRVVTYSRLPSYKATESMVQRRFREFVSLSEVLGTRFRGYFLPRRPEKNAVEGQRMKDQFIEERRISLEKYLNRLAAHPVIGSSDELRLFLELDGPLDSNLEWQMLQPVQTNFLEGTARLSKQLFGKESSVPQPGEITKPSTRTTDYLRRMREGFQSMKQEISGGSGVNSEDEKKLRLQTKSMGSQWDTLAETSRAAEKLVRKFERMGDVLGDLGLSFIKLSKCEETEGIERAAFTNTVSCSQRITSDTKQAGIALVRLARLARKVTGKMAQDLGELHDYLYFMPAVIEAMASREDALLTMRTLNSQHESKVKTMAELDQQAGLVVGGDRGKMRKANELRNEVSTLEQSIATAEGEYQKIKEVNFSELKRFRSQKNKDFTAMVHSLACVQAAYAERSAEVWLVVAKDLGASEQQLIEARDPPRRTAMRFD